MTFNPSVPQPSDLLSSSQPVLLANNQALDSVFDVDHYKFSDGTINAGKHKKITTPNVSIPSTTTDPVMYAHEVTANIKTLQFSRGVNNAIPTPLTKISGEYVSTPGVPQNILDLTGITKAIGRLNGDQFAGTARSSIFSLIIETGTIRTPQRLAGSATNSPSFSVSGSQLQINSVLAGTVFWTIEFLRVE